MIDFGHFRFAAAPKTGTTWALKVLESAGLKGGSKALVHQPGPKSKFQLHVSLIRHPCDWLSSYWGLRGGWCNVPAVDELSPLARESATFEEFVGKYLEQMPGQIEKIFRSYEADCYIRTDHLRIGFSDLLTSCGLSWRIVREATLLAPQNVSQIRHGMYCDLWKRVVQAESRMVEQFEFFQF